ncbi:MAG TPA: DUF5686 family protein [Saprospiraceae bacterium]|nr:DUF5686 family protein [Saprospiraceae bacterium]
MIARKKMNCFWVLILLTSKLIGQHEIAGRVLDNETNHPLAFVNIIFNQNVLTGTMTDINGKFRYSSPIAFTSLTFSYVGYEQKTVYMDSPEGQDLSAIKLSPSAFVFEEIVVKAGENPANRIIRNVIANKKINNPENITSFKYTSYNKVIYDFVLVDDSASEDVDELKSEVFKDGHALIMESVTERRFIHPDNSEEIILGVKVSGFKNPSFAPLATDLQPFSFYREIISIFDVRYINPISDGSLAKYDFRIEDTLYQQQDTTFILSFKPQEGKNYEALKGLLYINTSTYAIQHVIAEPYNKGLIDVKIQQQYQLIDGKQWFPEQLNFEIFVKVDSYAEVGMRANGKSHIKDVKLHPELKKKDFSVEVLRLDDKASARDTLFWNTHRVDPLSVKELKTYEVIDSLGEKYKFDKILTFTEKLSGNRIPVGFLDLDISKSLIFNMYEGFRLGLGAYTNDKLIKNLSLGGYFGFGLKDDEWKYGGEVTWTVDKQREVQIRGKYENTLLESGKTRLGFFNERQYDWRSFLATQMDNIEQSSIAIGLRALKYAKVNVSFNHTQVNPLYEYIYLVDETAPVIDFTNTDFTINIRYAHKEKLISSMGRRLSMGTKYPVLSLSYTRGLDAVLDGQFSFNKLEARVEESFYFKNLGESRIRVDAGLIDQPLPYALLFTGEGSNIRDLSVLVRNYFQTIGPYEFLSDRYVNVFYAHNFGSLLFHAGKFRPIFTIVQNIGWGTLSNPEYHQQIEFKTKEKGLYEAGLQIDNLVRMVYLNVGYLGFGIGGYYRYGPYALDKATDNMAFKVSMTFSTK